MSSDSTESSSYFVYHWIDGVERLELYKSGGYHPIVVGDVVRGRYDIVDKLGFGGHSTVWLAFDRQTKRLVALKIGISNPSSVQQESKILRALSETSNQKSPSLKIPQSFMIPTILDDFEIQGPNGTHACYTLTPAQSDLKTPSFSRLFPMRVARALSAGLTLAVLTVHSHGYVHGDIRLRNVLVNSRADFNSLSIEQYYRQFGDVEPIDVTRVDGEPLPSNVPAKAFESVPLAKHVQDFTVEDAQAIVLADFGTAFSPVTETRLGSDSCIPIPMRPPEALFDPETPLSYPSDVWSLALAIWDIVAMKFLFSESEPEDMVAALQIDVLGADNFPKEWWARWQKLTEYFTECDSMGKRTPTQDRDVWPRLDAAFDEYVQSFRKRKQDAGVFEAEEIPAFLDLMRRMLRFRPEERLTVQEVLRSDWMVKWALPEFGMAEANVIQEWNGMKGGAERKTQGRS